MSFLEEFFFFKLTFYFITLLEITTTTTTTNSQCGFRFRGVWGDPAVGNLTSISISTHKDVDSIRPTKTVLRKGLKRKRLQIPLTDVREKGRGKRGESFEIGSRDIPQQTRGAWCRDVPGKHNLQTSKPKTLTTPHRLSYCPPTEPVPYNQGP